MILDTLNVKFSNTDLRRELIVPERITSELAEETGLHIGDGSMNFYFNKNHYEGKYSLRGHIFDDVKHYNSRIKILYETLYNLKPNISKMESTGVCGFQIWSSCIVRFKHNILGLPLGNKINIKIPNYLINKKYIIDVIRGIFDTDGCIYLEPKNHKLYPRVQIGTISINLAEQLRSSLLKLGFRVTEFIENRKDKGWNNLHVLSIRGESMVKKWFDIIKPANPKHVRRYDLYLSNY